MKVSLLICAFLFALFGFGQDYKKIEKPEACKKALQEKHAALKNIKADFEETSTNELIKDSQKSKGLFYFQKQNQMRWENTSPKQRAILINGKSVKLYEDKKEVSSATTKMVVKRVQDLMVNLMSGDFLSEKDFTITYYESGSTYKLILVPKSSRLKKYVQKMELFFNKSTLLLNELKMISNDDEYVSYKFTNIKTNTSISETVFTKL